MVRHHPGGQALGTEACDDRLTLSVIIRTPHVHTRELGHPARSGFAFSDRDLAAPAELPRRWHARCFSTTAQVGGAAGRETLASAAVEKLAVVKRRPPEERIMTLLDLVTAVAESAKTDAEVVATVSHLINTGKIKLVGNFRGNDVQVI